MGSFCNADHGTLKSKQSLEAVRLIQLSIIRMMLGASEMNERAVLIGFLPRNRQELTDKI